MEARQRDQIAKNEALFRDVNERVKRIDSEQSAPADERWDFLCECGDAQCIERVSLTVEEYERVRSNPVHFFVVPGHEESEVEHVVQGGEGYIVVEKKPGERAAALETDPRA